MKTNRNKSLYDDQEKYMNFHVQTVQVLAYITETLSINGTYFSERR